MPYLVLTGDKPLWRQARRCSGVPLSQAQVLVLAMLYHRGHGGQHPVHVEGRDRVAAGALVRKGLAIDRYFNRWSLTEAGRVRFRACLGGGTNEA